MLVRHSAKFDGKAPQSCTWEIVIRSSKEHHLDLWLVWVELMGIFLDCIVFLAGSFFWGSFELEEDWVDGSAPESLDFVDGSSECLVAADAFEDSLSLAVVTLVWASDATLGLFLLGAPSLTASPTLSSGLPFASPAPDFPPSADLRVSLGLRAVLKKDKPLSSVLLFLRGPFDGGAALEDETPTLEDRKLAMDELLLEVRAAALFSAARLDLPSFLLPAFDLEGGPPWLTFLSDTALARDDSRLVLLSAALVLAEAELFSPPPLGDVLFGGLELCNPGEPLFLCWAESGRNTSGVWDDPFLEGVAVLEEPALPVLGGPSLLSLGLDADAAALVCVRDGDLSMAGEAGDRELDDVEEVAGRFLGLLSPSIPVFAEVLLTPALSAAPFLCFASFAAAPCRGLTCSGPVITLLLSAAWMEILCSASATAFEWTCSISLLLPGLLSEAARTDLPPDSLSGLGDPAKQEVDSLLSTTSPILSRVGEEEWDSREKREGELERSWSLAEWDQVGLVPFSLSTSGLAIEDLEENVCLCMPLTAGRLDKPGFVEKCQPIFIYSRKYSCWKSSELSPHHHPRSVLRQTQRTQRGRPARCAWRSRRRLGLVVGYPSVDLSSAHTKRNWWILNTPTQIVDDHLLYIS